MDDEVEVEDEVEDEVEVDNVFQEEGSVGMVSVVSD